MYKAFHICSVKLQGLKEVILYPQVPTHPMNGEDSTTPRICVGLGIDECLAALATKEYEEWVEVDYADPYHSGSVLVTEIFDPYFPTTEQVPDQDMTGEFWLLQPTRFAYLCDINIDINKYQYSCVME